jgi:speckle-type POZ protein
LVWSGKPSIICFVAEVSEYNRLHISEFDEGGCNWRVKIYPDGCKGSSDAGWVSVFLQLHRGSGIEDEATMAQFSVSLLDQDGEPVPSYRRNSSTIRRLGSKDQYGYRWFIVGQDLKRYLRDDCFRVRCEVIVNNIYGKPMVAPRPLVVPPSDLQRQLLSLLRSQ